MMLSLMVKVVTVSDIFKISGIESADKWQLLKTWKPS
jgi:hypothetical protein